MAAALVGWSLRILHCSLAIDSECDWLSSIKSIFSRSLFKNQPWCSLISFFILTEFFWFLFFCLRFCEGWTSICIRNGSQAFFSRWLYFFFQPTDRAVKFEVESDDESESENKTNQKVNENLYFTFLIGFTWVMYQLRMIYEVLGIGFSKLRSHVDWTLISTICFKATKEAEIGLKQKKLKGNLY